MSQSLSFVAPGYVSTTAEIPDPPVSAEMHDPIPPARGSNRRWSGAASNLLKCGDKFNHIQASWTVPRVYPTPDKWKSATTWDNDPSRYLCGIWVGIDGWRTSHDVLQAGTGMRCEVDKDGILSHETFAWFEWFPEDKKVLTNFKVEAGDVITVMVDYLGTDPEDAETHVGRAVFVNESNSTYTSFQYNYKAKSERHKFKGDTAEWILEGHGRRIFPNFGATFMYNCLASTMKGDERDLAYPKMIDMAQARNQMATPIKVTENIMGIYWGNGKSSAHLVDALKTT